MKKDFVLKSKKNDILRISTFNSKLGEIKGCVIYVHGFKGFKDWGFVPFLANFFSENGFFVITFNFSHNGVGESLIEFDELEKFENNTFSLEIEELNFIIDAYKNGEFYIEPHSKINIIGHSRGGAISLLTVAKRNDINSLALWASISKIDRFSEVQKNIWKKNGYIEVLNTRTNQLMKLGLPLLEDIEKNISDSLNIEKAMKKLTIPVLLAHGTDDTSVPILESEELFNWSNKENVRFLKIEGAGHTFNTAHPFVSSNSSFDFLLEETKKFFNEQLN